MLVLEPGGSQSLPEHHIQFTVILPCLYYSAFVRIA